MARRELGPAALGVARAVRAVLPDEAVVGCSGGADSLALALGAHWAAEKAGSAVTAVVVDHGLQAGSADVAARVVGLLRERGLSAESVRVEVREADGGLEAAARRARLAALGGYGVPVLLGHTLDDQAETVLLGLLAGSGTRAVAGMGELSEVSLDTPCLSTVKLVRPLLGLRRADTEQACREWGVEPWHDPMNDDPRFARVAIRQQLAAISGALGRDLAPALARTARLARADADLLDHLAAQAHRSCAADFLHNVDLPARATSSEPAEGADGGLAVDDLAPLPDALRWRVLHRWLGRVSPGVEYRHVLAVDALVTDWHGQGAIAIPGARVRRTAGRLDVEPVR